MTSLIYLSWSEKLFKKLSLTLENIKTCLIISNWAHSPRSAVLNCVCVTQRKIQRFFAKFKVTNGVRMHWLSLPRMSFVYAATRQACKLSSAPRNRVSVLRTRAPAISQSILRSGYARDARRARFMCFFVAHNISPLVKRRWVLCCHFYFDFSTERPLRLFTLFNLPNISKLALLSLHVMLYKNPGIIPFWLIKKRFPAMYARKSPTYIRVQVSNHTFHYRLR